MAPVAWSVVFVAGWVGAESAGPLVVVESALSAVLVLAGRDGQILVACLWEPDSPGRPPGKVRMRYGALIVVAPPVRLFPGSP